MAHYAYKNACYDIDYEKYKSLVKQYEAEQECEHDGDSNYDGDNWYIMEMWIREQLNEIETLTAKLEAAEKSERHFYEMSCKQATQIGALNQLITRYEND